METDVLQYRLDNQKLDKEIELKTRLFMNEASDLKFQIME